MPPTSCRLIANIAYGDHPRQICDCYLPETPSGPVPVIIQIHGGGWRHGDRGPLSAEALWVEAGWAVLRMNYRYSSMAPHPAQLEDARAVLRLVQAQAAAWGVDAQRICAVGHSAGGHIASLAACTTRGIRAVANLAGPTDLSTLSAYERSLQQDPSVPTMIDQLLDCHACSDRERAWAASPLAHVGPDTPPHLLVFAEADEIVPIDQGERFLDAMDAADRPCRLERLPEAGHVDPRFWQPEQMHRVLAFLGEHSSVAV